LKLIVQIPCYNEERTLPQTIADIPRQIPGVDSVEILVIDDGSRDRTAEVAREQGADHVVRNKRNFGLARTFRKGMESCLLLGADIVVNTDGDNQYCGADIPRLIGPILRGEADIVIGDRETHKIPHFSGMKKFLQWLGSGIVRRLAGIWVPDTVSGFRAFSREAAIRLNIVSSFSYTIETVIQAGRRNLTVRAIPVRTNPQTRESHLSSSLPVFIRNSGTTMVRMYAMYEPLKVFFYIGAVFVALGLVPVLRFLYFYFAEGGEGHVQSLVLASLLVLIGVMAFLAGLVADLISFNRQLIEMTLERVRRLELDDRARHPCGSGALRDSLEYSRTHGPEAAPAPADPPVMR
jgi:glycosyltransferase involved in cell wall biosynthesis